MTSSATLILRLALRNVLRYPRRSAITVIAVVVGVWSSITLAALARGLSTSIAEGEINTLTGHIQLHAPGYIESPAVDNSMPAPTRELLRVLDTLPNSTWAARVRVPAVVMSERESAGVSLLGIDPERERPLSFISSAIAQGSYLHSADDPGIILGAALLGRLQTELGKRVVVMSQTTDDEIGDRGFRVVGVFGAELEATETSYAFIGLHTAQQLLKLDQNLSEIVIRAADKDQLDPLVNSLKEVAPHLDIQSWRELKPFIVAILDLQGGFLIVWFVIVVLAISFGLVNTIFMSIFERTREFGLMQALGMPPRQILLQVLCESCLLVLVGVCVGNLISMANVWALRDGLDISAFAAGTAHFGASDLVYPTVFMSDWKNANLIITIIALLSSVYPAWKAARLTPIAAITQRQT